MDKLIIEKTFDEIISKHIHLKLKCSPTIAEMHNVLDSLTQQEKDLLLDFANRNERNLNKDTASFVGDADEIYKNLLEYGDEEDIFQWERRIFELLGKKQRDNILSYLKDFNESDYGMDDDVGYPNDKRGALEYQQEQYQEKQGYTEELKDAVEGWTGGWFEEMNNYILTGDKELGWGERFDNIIKNRAKTLQEYIQSSNGLTADTILFRGGHWDIGTKVGEVKSIPLFNSTSYSKDSAQEIGIEQSPNPEDKYMITIYAPKSTKGCMINAPSLSHKFPEHEYLLGKGQKYIVLDVNDDSHTASILLINE